MKKNLATMQLTGKIIFCTIFKSFNLNAQPDDHGLVCHIWPFSMLAI
jgi:hypothetical protein